MNKTKMAIYISMTCFIVTVISYLYVDSPLAMYCHELNPDIKNIAELVTRLGVATWYIVASIVLYLFFRYVYKNVTNAARSLFIFLSLSLSGIFIDILKWIAGRHRPIDLFSHGYFGFSFFSTGYELNSFPSGHAQTAFALATALTLLFPRWGILLFAVAVMVGVSRFVLTVHYLSDVIAGAGIGILFTMAVKYFFDRKEMDLSGK